MRIGGKGWAGQKSMLIIARGDLDICFYCHVTLEELTRTIDHVIPKAKGGTSALENLCLSCVSCNNTKGDHDAADFLRWLRRGRAGAIDRAPKQPARTLSKPLMQKVIVPALGWTYEHEEVKQRIIDVKRNSKGYPDP